jgi:hypothetical protein
MDLQQANMPRTPFAIYELLSKIMSFLPRAHVNFDYNRAGVNDPADDSNLMCAGLRGPDKT